MCSMYFQSAMAGVTPAPSRKRGATSAGAAAQEPAAKLKRNGDEFYPRNKWHHGYLFDIDLVESRAKRDWDNAPEIMAKVSDTQPSSRAPRVAHGLELREERDPW